MTRQLEDPLTKWFLDSAPFENPSAGEVAEAGGDINRVIRTRWAKKIETAVASWGEAARAYVTKPTKSRERDREGIVFEMQKRYSLALSIRDLLNAVADQNPTSPHENATDRIYRLPYSVDFLSMLSLRMARQDDAEGAVKKRSRGAVIEPPEPLKRFLDEVELGRIKRCAYEKCAKIFWASRIDKPCCSDTCRNAYKQQKHRDRERENQPYKEFLKKRSTPK